MSRYDLTRGELAEVLSDLPGYRTTQVWEGLYRQLLVIDEMTTLPKKERDRLSANEQLRSALTPERELDADDGETKKWQFGVGNGSIETVLMHHRRHSTVCVSSQAGCAMACTFCATGDAGFGRHLSVGEIIEQVIVAARAARQHDRQLDNVVFMGMGEPLANYDRVTAAIERIIDDVGLGARHITVSTVGVVPGINRISAFPRQVNLAVSLHAANDQLRNELVPLNRRYPLSILLRACQDYVSRTHRRLSFEWAMIEGTNDRPRDAEELAEIALDLHAHVNLIPLNPTQGGLSRGLTAAPPATVARFRDLLVSRGVNVTVRRTRGREIDAACGQLAGSFPTPGKRLGRQARPHLHAGNGTRG